MARFGMGIVHSSCFFNRQMTRIDFLTCERNDTSNQEPCIIFFSSSVKNFRLVFGMVAGRVFNKRVVKMLRTFVIL